MRDYDGLKPDWVPYLMFRNKPRFSSLSCNTDEHGFRLTHKNQRFMDYAAFEAEATAKGVVVGGSLAFGVGASSDQTTVASLLNRDSSVTWFNFGGRAFNSTQEVLLFLMYRPNVQRVVLLSGLNNLIAYPFSSNFVQGLGGFVEDARFHRQMSLDGNVRATARFVMESVWRRIGRFASRRRGAERVLDEPSADRYAAALEVVGRDLDVWRMLGDRMNFSVVYCLQPFALWSGKALSPEEAELFAILDDRGGGYWETLSRYLTRTYSQYRADLRALCELKKIDFLDVNEVFPKEGWLFCDRAHLTDEGSAYTAEIIRGRA